MTGVAGIVNCGVYIELINGCVFFILPPHPKQAHTTYRQERFQICQGVVFTVHCSTATYMSWNNLQSSSSGNTLCFVMALLVTI